MGIEGLIGIDPMAPMSPAMRTDHHQPTSAPASSVAAMAASVARLDLLAPALVVASVIAAPRPSRAHCTKKAQDVKGRRSAAQRPRARAARLLACCAARPALHLASTWEARRRADSGTWESARS